LAATTHSPEELKVIEQLGHARNMVLQEIHKVIIGQEEVIEQLLLAMFSRGHCLMVGVPGLAKTLLISTIASVLKLKFNRIQFTPDLMPSDITGTDVIEENRSTGERSFRFIRGPVFANIILADEINRTPPKTQAALLQAMQEYHVTAGGNTYPLDLPFFVLATQNPIEQEGTYPLPEAQLDRFMFMVMVDYPPREDERQIVKATTTDQTADVRFVLAGKDILAIQRIVRRIPVSDHVVDYAVNLVRATRPRTPDAPSFINEWLTWGAGPRAAQYLILGAKAYAILHGRLNVGCDDVRKVCLPVLRHRLFTNFNADAEGVTAEKIVERLLQTVPEPTADDYRHAAKSGKAPAPAASGAPVASAAAATPVPLASSYNNGRYNLSLQYPAGWDVVAENDADAPGGWWKVVGLGGPKSAVGRPAFALQIKGPLPLAEPKTFMAKADAELKAAFKGFEPVSAEEKKWRGRNVAWIVFKHTTDLGPMQQLNATVFLGQKTNVLMQFVCEAPVAQFAEMLPIFAAMVDSVRVGPEGLRLPDVHVTGFTKCARCQKPLETTDPIFTVLDPAQGDIVGVCPKCK
jgi:MoxR-like ATPase